MFRKRILLIGIFGLSIIINAVSGQTTTLFYGGNIRYCPPNSGVNKRACDGHAIYKANLEDGSVEKIFRSEYTLQDIKYNFRNGYLMAIQLSGQESYVNNFIVLDTTGKVLKVLNEDIKRYDLSPGGDKVVYITGSFRETNPPFRAESTAILDLNTFNKSSLPFIAYRISWATHDSCIYLDGYYTDASERQRGIYRYDPVTLKTTLTHYVGLEFSENGNYYIARKGEGGITQIYNSDTNLKIEILDYSTMKLARARYSWIDNNIIQIQVSDSTIVGWPKETIIFDLDSSLLLERFQGTPITKYMDDNRSILLLYSESYTIANNTVSTSYSKVKWLDIVR